MSSTPRKPPVRFTKDQTSYICAHYGTKSTVQEIANHIYGTPEQRIASPEQLELIRRAASNFRERGLSIGKYPERKTHPIGFIRVKPNGCRQQKTETGWKTLTNRKSPRSKAQIEADKKLAIARKKIPKTRKRTAATQKQAAIIRRMPEKEVLKPDPYLMKGKRVQTEKKYSHDENPANMKIAVPKEPMKLVRVNKTTQIQVACSVTDEVAIERYYAKINKIQR